MPSPFPGMDPFVEGAYRMNFHNSLSNAIRDQLVPKLRPRYIVVMSERSVRGRPDEISVAADTRYPDVGVYRRKNGAGAATHAAVSASTAVLRSVLTESVPHVAVEIRDAKHKRLVTAIEVLSPTNKVSPGRKAYHRRRERLLLGGANLIEIDLLSQGLRIRLEEAYPPGRYYVLLTRASAIPLTEVWAIRMAEPLPIVPVPLLEGDDDSALELQAAFTSMYDRAGYDLLVEYGEDPGVPVSDEEARFIDERLRSAGLRK